MSLENPTPSGNVPAPCTLPNQGAGDPALETINALYPAPLSHGVAKRAWPLCEDPQISAVADEWRNFPDNFFGDLIAECNPACMIYNQIHSSSTKPEIDVIKRRLCLVQYHQLRLEFKKQFFGLGRSDPLREFLETHMSELAEEQTLVRQNCELCATAGRKYHDLAASNHPGVLFLFATLDPIRAKTARVNRTTLTATFERIPDINELQKCIPYIGMMQKYDDTAARTLHMLKNLWIHWINEIKPALNERASVQYLFSNGVSVHPSLGRPLETLIMVKDLGGVKRQLDARVLRETVVCVRDTSGQTRYIRVGMCTDLFAGLLGNHNAGAQVQPPFGEQVPPFGAQIQAPLGTQVEQTYVENPASEMPDCDTFTGQAFFYQ